MRCKSCNNALSNKEAAHIEIEMDGIKHYTELCNKCRMQSTIMDSVLDRTYDHFVATEYEGLIDSNNRSESY